MKIKLLLINAALILFLLGLFVTIGGNMQIGALVILLSSAILLGTYVSQLTRSFKQSTLWQWQTLAGIGVLFVLAIIFMHGFSLSMGMMMVFRVNSFTSLYVITGFLLPILLFYLSSKSAHEEDKRWIRIGVTIGTVLGLAGLLGFARILPFPTQFILYSWVFVLFFYLIFLTKKYVSSKEKAEKHESPRILKPSLV